MVFVLEIWSPIRPSRVGYIVRIRWYYTTARPAVGPERLSIYILFNCRKGRAGQMKVYRGYCDSRTQYSPTVYGPSRFTAIVVGFFFFISTRLYFLQYWFVEMQEMKYLVFFVSLLTGEVLNGTVDQRTDKENVSRKK